MAKKKVEEGYEAHIDRIEVARFPVHENENPMDQSMQADGTTVFTPSDPYWSVKIKGYYDDGAGYSGYEVQARPYVKDGLYQWVRGKKWETVGYVKPFTFQVHWLKRSQWLSDQLGQLVKDIQAYEAVMKERIKNGI